MALKINYSATKYNLVYGRIRQNNNNNVKIAFECYRSLIKSINYKTGKILNGPGVNFIGRGASDYKCINT